MLLYGVEISELNALRDNIIQHFGSISAFARATGYSYRKLKSTLIHLEFEKKDYEDIKAVYDKEYDPDVTPFRISEDDSEAIRIAILSNFKKVTLFCEKHTEYNSVYISNIINRKLKLRSKKFKQLEKLLTDKYGLK